MFPTDVTVSMTIADLYPMMHLPLHETAHDLTKSYGLTIPLITDSTGKKFGKSE
jgi:tyrosyl-tRNA synthetase